MDRRILGAVVLASAAAFLWATYYFFVLGAPEIPPSALLVDPFIAGGAGFLVLAGVRQEGGRALQLLRDPAAYGRAGLLLGMQLAVLASTYLTGAVDTSLLSLLGDVVLTPVALLLLYREGGERFRSAGFLAGLLASTVGATFVIAGGAAVETLSGWAWVAAPTVPVLVALYFLYTARANRRVPMAPLVGQATLLAGGFGVAVSPLLPGGTAGLLPASAFDLAVVVALGLTSFFLGPYLYFQAIETSGLVLPALLMTGIPIFTLALEVAIFHSAPPLLALLGIPVAIAGSVVALRGPHAPWTASYSHAGPPG